MDSSRQGKARRRHESPAAANSLNKYRAGERTLPVAARSSPRAGDVTRSKQRPAGRPSRSVGLLQAALCLLMSAVALGLVSGAHPPALEPDGPSAAALEAELNAILERHEPQDSNSRLLSQEIISRLMIGNLTENQADQVANIYSAGEEFDGSASNELAEADEPGEFSRIYSGPDAMRLKKLFSLLTSAELAAAGAGGLNIGQYPVLPASQAATIKRASSKISNLLRQQQARQNNYGRNTYDFGLGKRPDSSNILRLGDSSIGHVQSVSGQLGKRPAHRYDFGLGKRVASPTYPRYDFGLGKRAPNRIRYDFGLGK